MQMRLACSWVERGGPVEMAVRWRRSVCDGDGAGDLQLWTVGDMGDGDLVEMERRDRNHDLVEMAMEQGPC